MRWLPCPNQESLLEFVSIPDELSFLLKLGFRVHLSVCRKCRKTAQQIEAKCQTYFHPQPEVTSSLLRVYSRLQKDETLVLKGRKLAELRTGPRSWNELLFSGGWLFRGGVVGTMAVLVLLVIAQLGSDSHRERLNQNQAVKVPLAQFRIEDRNTVKVHYVQPELLQSMEFETTSAR